MKLLKVAASVLAAGFIAGAHAAPTLSESFDDVAGLAGAGWVLTNLSSPVGLSWFQGNSGIFAAESGAPDAYVGANFNSTTSVTGVVDNWLISPEVSIGAGSTLTFYTQASDAGFLDKLDVLFSSGASSNVASFTTVIGTVGSGGSYPVGSWMAVTLSLPTAATGRIAFHYTVPNAMDASYIGIDSVSVATAVPESSTLAMLGLGLAAVAVARRRQAAHTSN